MSRMRWKRQAKRVVIFVLGICSYFTLKTLMFISENDSSVDQILPVEHLPKALAVVQSRSNESLSPLYTIPASTSSTCSTNFLGIPKYAADKNCKVCQEFTCQKFLFSPPDNKVFKEAREWMKKHPKAKKPDGYFINITKNCADFKKYQGYHGDPLSDEEKEFPIAFNIIMHKDVEQIERLLRAIYRPQNEYCIHVDKKQHPDLIAAIRSIARCFDNVHVAKKLERVTYAGYSRLQADINCMDDLSKVKTKWRYLINLAGQSFPLKTNQEMVKILKLYNGANDIEGIYGRRILRGRFQQEWMEINTNTSHPGMKKTGRRNPKPPFDIDIVRGSAYGVFSRAFVEFILHNEKAQALLQWSRKTWSPDEHYWATLHHTYSNPHLKTPGAFSGVPNEKPWLAVYAAWGGASKCYGMWKRGICVFGVGDLSLLVPHPELFANKFYLDYQPLALDCMEAWIQHKTHCVPPFDMDYYSKLPFIRKTMNNKETEARKR